MKKTIMLISYTLYEYDGRLKELIEVFKLLGDIYVVSRSEKKEASFSNHIVYKKKSYFGFIAFCVKEAIIKKNLSIVVADNRKAIIPAYIISRIFPKIYLIHDSREMYVKKDVNNLTGKIGCIIEVLFNKKFDIIISANQERARIMKMLYKLEHRPYVYENIRKLEYNEDFNLDKCLDNYCRFLKNNKIKIVSTAGLSLDRGGKTLIEDIGIMSDESELFIIGGWTPNEKEEFNRLISKRNFSNIYLMGRMESNELKWFISNCDIGVVFYHKRDLNNKYCASGKVFEFLFEDLPIICSDNIPLIHYCKKYGVGVAGNNYRELVKTVTTNRNKIIQNIKSAQKVFSIEDNRLRLANEIRESLRLSDRTK